APRHRAELPRRAVWNGQFRVLGCGDAPGLRAMPGPHHLWVRAGLDVRCATRWPPPAGGKGITNKGATLSFRWKRGDAPVGAAEPADPASVQFSDQLIAVLPRLRRFARGLSGAAAEADDLVQAACERALARAHQFEEGTRFDSWMFRIVQTIWIDELRAREVRKEDGDVAEERLGSDAPVRRIEARLALAEVRQAVQLLPPDQRTVLMLVTVEGLS